MDERTETEAVDPIVAPPVPGEVDRRNFAPYRQLRTPSGWTKLEQRLKYDDPSAVVIGFYRRDDTAKQHMPLVVLATVDLFDKIDPEAGAWFHLHVSRGKAPPLYADVFSAKDAFIGRDEPAVQMLAPPNTRLDGFENCAHVIVRIDKPTVPDAVWKRAQPYMLRKKDR